MNDYVVRVHIGGTKVRVNFILADQLAEIRTQSNMSGMLALHLLNHRAATSLAFSLILNFIFSIFLSECKRNWISTKWNQNPFNLISPTN